MEERKDMLLLMGKKISFQVHYDTKWGENVYIIGNIDSLGKWKKAQVKMEWNEGNVWKTTIELFKNLFEYKYIIVDSESNIILWEEGPNRICDVVALSNNSPTDILTLSKSTSYLRINGGIAELGMWNTSGPLPMVLGEKSRLLPTGSEGKCWELEIIVHTEKELEFIYKYSIYEGDLERAIWEREPSRRFKLSKCRYEIWKNKRVSASDIENRENMAVNGIIEELDVNLVVSLNYNVIEGTHTIIGAYPQSEEDIEEMAREGVTGVINVQTVIDMKHRQVDWENMLNIYEKYNIKAVNYQIHDFNAEDLTLKLPAGAALLNQMVTDGLNVFVHCTAGMGRAPALVVAYLAIYKGCTLQAANTLVHKYRVVATPNLNAINKALAHAKGNNFLEDYDNIFL